MIEIRHKTIHDGQSIQDAYDDLYQERELRMRDSFYLWLLELLDLRPGAVVVDVACGNGRLVEIAKQQGFAALGLEIAWQGIAHAAAAEPSAGWLLADGHEIPFADSSVDAVYSIGSLEHYDAPFAGVAEIARVLKPAGQACILLPNSFGLFGNISHVATTGEVFDDGQPRQRYATRGTWEAMLRSGGLVAERVIGWGEVNRPRTGADALWLARQPQRVVRAALATLLPVNLANQLVYLCRRADAAHDLPVDGYVPTFPQ